MKIKNYLIMKYRKKPIIVEAIKYKKGMKHPAICIKADAPGCAGPHIHTLEGCYMLTNKHWIIKGIKGEYYPCDNVIFKKTYEKVKE